MFPIHIDASQNQQPTCLIQHLVTGRTQAGSNPITSAICSVSDTVIEMPDAIYGLGSQYSCHHISPNSKQNHLELCSSAHSAIYHGNHI